MATILTPELQAKLNRLTEEINSFADATDKALRDAAATSRIVAGISRLQQETAEIQEHARNPILIQREVFAQSHRDATHDTLTGRRAEERLNIGMTRRAGGVPYKQGEGLESIASELEQQEKTLSRIRLASHPDLIKEQLMLEQSINREMAARETLKIKLNTDPVVLKDELRQEHEKTEAERERASLKTAMKSADQANLRQDALSRLGGDLANDQLTGERARHRHLQRQANPLVYQNLGMGQASADLHGELEQQEKLLIKLQMANDPTIYRERLANEERITEQYRIREGIELRHQLANPEQMRQRFAQEEENANLRHDMGLARNEYMSGSGMARNTARKQLEQELSDKQKLHAEARARGELTPWKTLGGAAMDIGKVLPGGGLLGGMQGVYGAATGQGAQGIAGALSGLGAAAGPIGMIAAAAPKAIEMLGGLAKQIKGLVISLGTIASPGEALRYEWAAKSLQAALGRGLVPVFELLTDSTKLLADAVFSILPSMQQMRAIFSPIRDAIQKDLKPALADLVPLFREMSRVQIQQFAMGLKLLLTHIQSATTMMKWTTPWMSMGKGGLKPAPHAPRQAQFSGVEEYLKQTYQMAMTQAMGGSGKKPEEETASAAKAIEKKVVQILDYLEKKTGIKSDRLRSALTPISGDTAAAVEQAIKRGLIPS